MVCTETSINSTYDKENGTWISQLDMELTNNSNVFQQEYSVSFELPPGCWISDYYLYVNGNKEHGLLSEKKSAMWIYNQIRNRERRDPGILYYLGGNRVAFKVFPFGAGEVRKTGIEFMHKDPLMLNYDGENLYLGNADLNRNRYLKDNSDFLYISVEDKKLLPVVTREPYYHFIVDVSEERELNKTHYANSIESLLKRGLIPSENMRISFTNSVVQTYDLNHNLNALFDHHDFDGGFFLDRAIRKVLFESYENCNNTYPVIVVVTDDFSRAIIGDDFSDFKITYPESPYFYSLAQKGELISHSLYSESRNSVPIKPELHNSVYAYPDRTSTVAYLSLENLPGYILSHQGIYIPEDQIFKKDWNSALLLHGLWMEHRIYPAGGEKQWKQLIRSSFESNIMTPVTSFIVVENEAQKAMLIKKQKQVLKSSESLDLMEEEPVEMTEPGFIIFLFIKSTSWPMSYLL